VFTHHLRTGDKGFLHWGKVLAVEGSECTIKWQTDKKPSSHSITHVFLTEVAAWAAFHSIPSSDGASEALCIQSLTTRLLTQKRPCTQLHRRIPRRRVMQPGFFCSFLLQCNVPPTCLCIAAVSDSHSHQLLGHLHPNTCVPALYAHFLQLLQSAQSVPSSRFLPQTLLRVRPFLLIFSAVHCATHVPVRQCLTAIVISP
jgi:hypothetical protein